MNPRSLRRIWFTGLFFLLPWPMFVFHDALVPAARYALLGIVASAVALAEGGSGPVGLIVTLFAVMTVWTSLACWLLAWAIAKLLGPLPAAAQRAVTFGSLVLALGLVLAFEPYRTPFGRALTGGLLEILS